MDRKPRPPRAPASRPRASQPPRGPSGQRVVTPARQPASRSKVAFAVLGLVVVFSLILGSALYGLGLDWVGTTQSDSTDRRNQPNLVATYQTKLRDNPQDVNSMLLLANILQNTGDYAGAIVWYERAVELRPTDLEARLAFGQTLASYGERFDAEVQYKKALELDPASARTEYYLGQLYGRWDPPRLEEARLHYNRASELEPEGAWGRAARGALDRLNATPTPGG